MNKLPELTLPEDGAAKPDSPAQVFSLVVLVGENERSGKISARSGNLRIPPKEAETIRAALSSLVHSAKFLIAERVNSSEEIPWIDPQLEPAKSESRFVVPLHL